MVFRNGQPARYLIDGLSFNVLYFKVSLALILAFGNFSDIHIDIYDVLIIFNWLLEYRYQSFCFSKGEIGAIDGWVNKKASD
jgi:hypothetical protein